jgi:hypothetical protein
MWRNVRATKRSGGLEGNDCQNDIRPKILGDGEQRFRQLYGRLNLRFNLTHWLIREAHYPGGQHAYYNVVRHAVDQSALHSKYWPRAVLGHLVLRAKAPRPSRLRWPAGHW